MSPSDRTSQPTAIEPRAEPTTGPLRRWLGALGLVDFLSSYLGQQPFAGRGLAMDSIPTCDWDVLARLLEAGPPDLLVVARGQLVAAPPPRSLAALRTLFRGGIGIAIRRPELHCPEVAKLGRAFAGDLAGEQRVIIFATPAGAHGFGWHYDAEDVFIVQTAGDKEYLFRRNTLDPHPRRGAQPDFGIFRHETSPVLSCRLLPGDWLYLPRGYWHVAHPRDDSLSISIGVFPAVS